MSALPSALPLAFSASLYPPALLVLVLLLTGDHPRRLVLAYFFGAALMVVSAGLIALAVINTAARRRRARRPRAAGSTSRSGPGSWHSQRGRGAAGARCLIPTRRRTSRGRHRPHRQAVEPRNREPEVGVRPRPRDVPALPDVSPGGQGHRGERRLDVEQRARGPHLRRRRDAVRRDPAHRDVHPAGRRERRDRALPQLAHAQSAGA